MLKCLPLVDLEPDASGATQIPELFPLRSTDGSSRDLEHPSHAGFSDIVSTELPFVVGGWRAAEAPLVTDSGATDANGGVETDPAPGRAWLVWALSELGEGPLGLEDLSDEQLRTLHAEISASPAALAGRAWLVRALSELGEDRLDLEPLSDGQLRTLYAEVAATLSDPGRPVAPDVAACDEFDIPVADSAVAFASLRSASGERAVSLSG